MTLIDEYAFFVDIVGNEGVDGSEVSLLFDLRRRKGTSSLTCLICCLSRSFSNFAVSSNELVERLAPTGSLGVVAHGAKPNE